MSDCGNMFSKGYIDSAHFKFGSSVTQTTCLKPLRVGIHVQEYLKLDTRVTAMCKSFHRLLRQLNPVKFL